MDCSQPRRLVDHYAVLDVTASVSMAELRSSYRRMALRTHPDKGGSPEDFRQVLEAFAVLSSSRDRAAYDSSLPPRPNGKPMRSNSPSLSQSRPPPSKPPAAGVGCPNAPASAGDVAAGTPASTEIQTFGVHVQHAAERRHSRRGMLGTESAETPEERVLEDPMALAPVSPRTDSSKSTSTSDESDIDEVLALGDEECSTLFAIEDAQDVAMGLAEDDSGESDPDCTLPAAATRASKRQAVDFHIILVQLRECVEQGVEGADGVEGPLAFEQSLPAACKQLQEELSKMSLSFSIVFRAFGVRLDTPSTTSWEEALEVRSRLLTAREQGVSAMQACLLEVLTAGRTNVHKKRSRSWSQAE
ncbi:unnamed protein product, partial [Polarella glacialis]